MTLNIIRTIAVVALTATAQLVQATDVFRLAGFGAISRAMGGTATAYNIGAAGMMTNPATLSLMAIGSEFHLGIDSVIPDIASKNLATRENAATDSHSYNRGPYLAPQAAYTYHYGQWAFGVGAFAQAGLGSEYGKHSFLSRANGDLATNLPNASRLLVLNIPVAVSYQVNDKLSIGMGVDAIWQGMNLQMLLGADQVGSLIGAGRVKGSLLPVLAGLPDLRGAHFDVSKNEDLASGMEAWGFSGRVGMTYKLSESTTMGMSYTMESEMEDLKGDAILTAIDGVAGNIALSGRIKLRDFRMPAHMELGFSHQFNNQWMVAVDVSQVFWKHAFKDIDVGFVADGGDNIDILLPQSYRNQTILAIGSAYSSGNWVWRIGGRIASQSLRPHTLFAVIPAIPRRRVSTGFSYMFSEGNGIHFAYSRALREDMKNRSLPATSAPIRVSHSQHNLTLTYTHSF